MKKVLSVKVRLVVQLRLQYKNRLMIVLLSPKLYESEAMYDFDVKLLM